MKPFYQIIFILSAWGIILLSVLLRIFAPFFRFKKQKNTVLILAMFYPENAGYHYRVRVWSEMLISDGFKVGIKNLYNKDRYNELVGRNSLRTFLILGYWKRLLHILQSARYEKVIVRRAIVPYNDYGNLFLEKLLLSLHPGAILDLDDDLTNNRTEKDGGSLFGKLLLENRLNFYRTLGMYRNFFAGSEFLAELIREKNTEKQEPNIEVIPTCVEYSENVHKTYKELSKPIVLGWIGSDSNRIYLDDITADLNKLNAAYKVKLMVISGTEYRNEKADFEIENRKWSLETQEKDLLAIDFGLMPLRNDKMSRAKCGFKLIQYMNLGIVSLASKVTANAEIIQNENQGILVEVGGSWKDALVKLIENTEKLPDISQAARERIKEAYCFEANYDKFKSLLS